MKTYKQLLYKRWWRGNFVVGVAFFALILFLVFSGKVEYTFLLIPVLFISIFFGGVKCPNCKRRLITPPGPRGFERVNHCAGCGFDLNQEAPTDDQIIGDARERSVEEEKALLRKRLAELERE